MATITGYTAARMKTIEDESIVNSYIRADDHLIVVTRAGVEIDTGVVIDPKLVVAGSIIGDNLVLKHRDDTTMVAGNVRGPQGDQGPAGSTDIFLMMGG